MLKNKLIFGIVIAIIFFNLYISIYAIPTYEQNIESDLIVPCTINGDICSTNATCVCSLISPQGNLIFDNDALTQYNATFHIILPANKSSELGEYQFPVTCCENGVCSTNRLKFNITPNGKMSSSGEAITYLILMFVLLSFFGLGIYYAITTENLIARVGASLGSYLLLVALSFIAWNLSRDYLTSAPFLISMFRIIWLVLMFAFFPLLLALVIYMMYMMLKIKEIQKLIERGVPADEAYERYVRKGMRGF